MSEQRLIATPLPVVPVAIAAANTVAYLWKRTMRKGFKLKQAGAITVFKRQLRKQLPWQQPYWRDVT